MSFKTCRENRCKHLRWRTSTKYLRDCRIYYDIVSTSRNFRNLTDNPNCLEIIKQRKVYHQIFIGHPNSDWATQTGGRQVTNDVPVIVRNPVKDKRLGNLDILYGILMGKAEYCTGEHH